MNIAPSVNSNTKSRKRKFTSIQKQSSDSKNANKEVVIPIQENELEYGECKHKFVPHTKEFTLNSFSDEVLFEIFKHLDALTLLYLEETCRRFYGLIQDHRFWNSIDLTSKRIRFKTVERCFKKIHYSTGTVKVWTAYENTNNVETVVNYSKTLLDIFVTKCSNLRILELREAYIDFRIVQILDFPKTLKRLVLDNCNVSMSEDIKTIFCGIDTHLIFLEELCIENSSWFDPFFVMVFSKIPELQFLSLKGCSGLTEFVPYGSMAARFGFKKLEHLDVRETPIKDSDIQCFNAVSTLKVLLLECPSSLQKFSNRGNSGNVRAQENNLSNNDISSVSFPSNCSSSSTENSHINRRFVINRQQPDQIIYLDLHNRRRAIVLQQNHDQRPHSRGQINAFDQLNDVFLHPMLWDFINPVERPLNNYSNNQDNYSHLFSNSLCSSSPSPISDRGICCFGRPPRPVEQGIIWVSVSNRPSENRFERLSVRYYTSVTDISLQHLVQCSPHLVYLDLTGTSVTREGIQIFKNSKPHCQILANHLFG